MTSPTERLAGDGDTDRARAGLGAPIAQTLGVLCCRIIRVPAVTGVSTVHIWSEDIIDVAGRHHWLRKSDIIGWDGETSLVQAGRRHWLSRVGLVKSADLLTPSEPDAARRDNSGSWMANNTYSGKTAMAGWVVDGFRKVKYHPIQKSLRHSPGGL